MERLQHLDSALQLSGTRLVAKYARQTVSRLDDVADLEEHIHLVDESQAAWDKFADLANNLETTKQNIVYIQRNAADIYSKKEQQQQQPDAVGEGAGASKADDASDAGAPQLSEDVGDPGTQPMVEEKVEEDNKKKKTKKEQDKKTASGKRGRSGSASESNASERRVSPRIASQNSASEKKGKK